MPIPAPIGPQARIDDTPNAGNQAGDHNVFQQRIDALIGYEQSYAAAPLGTLAEAFAGVAVAPGALRRWLFATDRIVHIAVGGDSTSEGLIPAGLSDPWTGRLARALARAYLPIAGYGFHGMWRANTAFLTPEWNQGRKVLNTTLTNVSGGTIGKITVPSAVLLPTGADIGSVVTGAGIPPGTVITALHSPDNFDLSNPVTPGVGIDILIASDLVWANPALTDTFDLGPFGQMLFVPNTATAASAIYWEMPANISGVVGFDIHWADHWTAGANWSLTVDDGLTWIVNPVARTGGDVLRKTTRVQAVTNRVGIRAGAGGGVGIVGITPYVVNPNTGVGIMLDLIAQGGSTLNDAGYAKDFLRAASAGDPLAILDNGGTHPGGVHPRLFIGGWTNDVVSIPTTTAWNAGLTAIEGRLSSYSDIAWWSPFERSDASPTDQAAYRAATAAFAATYGWAFLDLYKAWSAMLGVPATWAAANAAGLMSTGVFVTQAHSSQLAHNDLAARWRRALMTFS